MYLVKNKHLTIITFYEHQLKVFNHIFLKFVKLKFFGKY